MPALDRRFRADAVKQKAEALAAARADRRARAGDGLGWNPHSFSRGWDTAGSSNRLLSLVQSTGFYSGGAHPNSGTSALLWDRRLSREIAWSMLLQQGQSWTGAVRGAFCVLLDRERAEKRGEKVVRGSWPDNCPAIDELTVAPADKNGNGRFDHLRAIADNYVAGPYAEAGYEYDLPGTATMLARLKPKYASSFEPQPPVQ